MVELIFLIIVVQLFLDSDAYQQVSLSVTPEKTNEVVNYIAFAFVYGYNENEMLDIASDNNLNGKIRIW